MATQFDLAGLRVLVTGAGGNIGQGIVRSLAASGASVILHYRHSAEPAQALATELGGEACCVQADLADAASIQGMYEQLLADDRVPQALVNNAADQSVAMLAEMSPQQWRLMQAANLDGVFQLSQLAAQHMHQRYGGGAMVNISSIEGSDPAVGHGHYATSKAGLNMLTRAFALEMGERGIRVNAVSPGLIGRDGIEQQWPEGVARWQERAPLTRLGTPQDIGHAVAFLLSDAAGWITGHNLVVDGGMSSQNRW